MRCLRLLPLLLFGLTTSSSLLAQLKPAPKDDPALVNRNSGVLARNVARPNTSAGKSTTGLSSLPPDAQGPISGALGKDDSGYWVRPSAKGFLGENPRQALSVGFTKQGAELRSNNLRWALETRSYGYGAALHRVEAVAPQAKANRVEYPRDDVTEWYENGPLGLEQGFTLAHRPKKSDSQPLTLELGLRGDLVAALDPGGRALELRGKDGKAALRYTGLTARDATGRELTSWLELRGDQLLVRVKDEGARYPLVLDPWIQQAELTASDGAPSDYFGCAVAVSGSTIVVGAYDHMVGSNSEQGAAYVFVESGGTWSQQAELTASGGQAEDYFGSSVAIDGSMIVVGAPTSYNFDAKRPGAAYIFVQNGTTWSQQAELTASDGAPGDAFGLSMAIGGGTVVAGAWGHDEGQGAVYVFVQNGTTWSQQAELTASDGAAFDALGYSVAISGSTIVAGSWGKGVGSNFSQGAAYVFVQNGTTWSQQAELTASDGAAFDCFGYSVAISGSTVVAGAYHHNGNQGAAYVFVQDGSTWSQQQELTASDGAPQDLFGSSAAMDGNTLLVGAPQHLFGAAYVFAESEGTWSQQQELLSESGGRGFSDSVAVSGSTVAVGELAAGLGQSGAAYVFGTSGPLYTLVGDPSSLEVAQSGQGTSIITITPWDGFSGSVSFSALNLPNGISAAFNPNPATNSTTMTLTASSGATASSSVIVTGTSSNLTQTMPLPLTVTTSVTVSPASLNFANEAVNGGISAAKAVTLQNSGSLSLNISSIAFTLGTNFTISGNTCKATLRGGAKCVVSVKFMPTQLGALTDILSFTDNAAGSPQTVALSGTGIAQATLSPSSYTFKTTKVGDTSAAQKFTLKNNLPTTLTGISYSTAAPFAISTSTCGATLDSKKSCTISVTFSPTGEETYTGTLTVNNSANDSPQTSSLTGTGD